MQLLFLAACSRRLANGSGNVGGFSMVISPSIATGTAYLYDRSSLLTAETPGAPVELRAVEPSIAGFEVGVVGVFVAELMEPAAVQKLTVAPFREAAATGSGRSKAS
jgi:hypothetical protein